MPVGSAPTAAAWNTGAIEPDPPLLGVSTVDLAADRALLVARPRVTFFGRNRGVWALFYSLELRGQELVLTQRFYLGGPNSHRGFTYNRLSYQRCSGALDSPAGPVPLLLSCRDTRVDQLADLQRLPTGGDTLLLGQLELRLGLFRLARQWVTLAAFVDAGDVTPPAATCAVGGCGDGLFLHPVHEIG